MKLHTLTPPLLFTALMLTATASQAVAVYANDFQSSVGNEWSHSTLQNTPTPYPFGARSFLGEFGNDTVSLNLSGLTPHSALTLSFDLYLIRTWDGSSIGTASDFGNDSFKVAVGNGPVLLDATFSNGNTAGQTFGPAAINPQLTGAAETYSLGYVVPASILAAPQVMDSVYTLRYTFAHSADQLTLDFSGYGLQAMDDESWGLDNVHVSMVPEPGVAPMLALGMLAVAWGARRRVKTS
ncbi:MAG TPA: PEP-CTERM sorting domain-containing protein [Thiobacillus sp.]|nr:MAG: hypothetical protein B7Y50_02305 [Hydrogenophilales bacterium 28-61-11]HQT30080.1 PEP-CTERM sorting domain-containing protein [Thiobacillus sp.]HQT70680.1 PEP-CTERM sorting domain-containing protein [Thiobacillus sp.]